jgi:hypothetical protein
MASFATGIRCEYPMGHATSDTGHIWAVCAAPAVFAVMGRSPGHEMPLWAAVCNEHLDAALSEMEKLRPHITRHQLGDSAPY